MDTTTAPQAYIYRVSFWNNHTHIDCVAVVATSARQAVARVRSSHPGKVFEPRAKRVCTVSASDARLIAGS